MKRKDFKVSIESDNQTPLGHISNQFSDEKYQPSVKMGYSFDGYMNNFIHFSYDEMKEVYDKLHKFFGI